MHKSNNYDVQSTCIVYLQHENYDPSDLWANDIALIRIPQPVDMSVPEVGTICLPSTNNFVGKECWASGWGLDESKTFQHFLHPYYLWYTDFYLSTFYTG